MTKRVWSRWLHVILVLLFNFYVPLLRVTPKKRKAKNSANIQPSWPHAWSITHMHWPPLWNSLAVWSCQIQPWRMCSHKTGSLLDSLVYFVQALRYPVVTGSLGNTNHRNRTGKILFGIKIRRIVCHVWRLLKQLNFLAFSPELDEGVTLFH